MKIYLAARFGRWEELEKYAADLVALGHTVTSRWHRREYAQMNAQNDADHTHEQGQAWANEDLEDIRQADLMISFTEKSLSATGSRGGRHVEFGVALALNKVVCIVGPREHVFHHLVLKYRDWAAFLVAFIMESWEESVN